ncbi:hypothetical protein [Paraburkholderia dioscoreae]|uniref:Pectate lyase superfamily protein domain-containing protein n=1 Tax=Paraburkholderia dioscoreae TaxID=2604047 RepID=A0A5Q4ZC67_9BURK|nr:hypothetical protein [Paraburkholderia dioscoreae]VVD32659.1 exported protein of unknown function [Paraburkholderia dioscoreae]
MRYPILSAIAAGASISVAMATYASSQSEPIGMFRADSLVNSEFTLMTPMRFGALGDGSNDDTAALNRMYAAARKAHQSVFLRGREYHVTGQIDARGVSTLGEGATLSFALNSSKTPMAFFWGGTDSFVTEVNFQLSNSGAAAMQGVLNSVNDVTNQRFYRNRVVCAATDKSGVKSNIYGLWMTGTGLDGVSISDNRFENCTYGAQINNQNGMSQSVRTNPLGKPSSHINISNNTFIDATLGINTPHIFVSDVVIADNTIEPKNLRLDLPLNVAHVSRLSISGNVVTSNASSANGTLHVEDASGAVTITGNVITVKGKNNGIEVGVRPSVSHDVEQSNRMTITGNHVAGPGADAVETVGILLPDRGTVNTTISGNYVANFARCVDSVDVSNISGNTLAHCVTPIAGAKSPLYPNMVSE